MLRLHVAATLAACLLAAGATSAPAGTESQPAPESDRLAATSPSTAHWDDVYTVEAHASRPDASFRTQGLRRSSTIWCRTVRAAYVKRTLLGFVAYKFWVQRHFCWRRPRVVGVTTSTYVTDNDGLNQYEGIVNAWGHFYMWCCRDGKSGHRAFRQAEFRNCIIQWGCLSTTYPWVRIAVHGDGSWSYRVGS